MTHANETAAASSRQRRVILGSSASLQKLKSFSPPSPVSAALKERSGNHLLSHTTGEAQRGKKKTEEEKKLNKMKKKKKSSLFIWYMSSVILFPKENQVKLDHKKKKVAIMDVTPDTRSEGNTH